MNYCIARSGQADSMRQAFLWAILPTLVLFLVMPSVGNTQAPVVTDITSSGLGTVVPDPNLPPPSDGVYNITGGTRPGDGPNLFHSFGDFSIREGHIANFLNDSPFTTTNIIGRVTGGNTSNIYGTIRTNDIGGFGNANLFLINPSGIVFGPHGSFNVDGSVSFSTAQYLRLFDGVNSANFYADPDSVFAMAPLDAFGFLPAAYGFLTAPDPGATITVQGSDLSVDPGQSISLVGREVVIQDATLPDETIQRAHLSAPDGSILLASAASPGEFDVATLQALPNVDGVSGVSFTSFGSVSLTAGSSINVTGANTVFVKGGQLVLSVNNATLTTTSDSSADSDTISLGTGSSIVTSNSGAELGADVQITVGKLNLDGAGTAITTGTFGGGNGGSITANVETLSVTNGAAINSSNISFGLGVGGNITVQGLQGAGSEANLVTLGSSAKITTEMWLGPGEGGDISITADTLRIDNLSLVTSDQLFGTGKGGDLVLNVRELTVSGGSIVRTADLSFGFDGDFNGEIDPSSVGSGGDLTIRGIGGAAADSVVLSGDSLVGTQAQDGTGGSVSITTSVLSLGRVDVVNDIDISSIFTSTAGYGRGGNIDVRVQEATFLGGATIASQTTLFDEIVTAGTGGNITMRGLGPEAESKAESLTIEGFFSGITSNSFGLANPGEITVYAKTVSLRDQAVIEGGNTVTTGTGGRVTIVAESVDITGGSHISSHAFGLDAGQVTITAHQLTLDNGSILTSTASPVFGRGGDVVLHVGNVSLANGSTINSSTSGTGQAGNLIIASGSVTMTSGSTISAGSSSSGNAGDISINSKEVPGNTFEMWHSTISTSAALADGGNIGIFATNMVRLTNSVITSSVGNETKTDTLGGNVTIDPQFVVLQNSQIRANAFAGSGGDIDIIAGVFIADPSSLVTASSERGISGIVNIQSPLQNVGEELTPLSDELSSAAALLAQQCAARAAGGTFSTFVVAAREGLPVEPGGFLASPSLTAELFASRFSERDSHSQLSAVTGLFPKYAARPIQLAKLGNACR